MTLPADVASASVIGSPVMRPGRRRLPGYGVHRFDEEAIIRRFFNSLKLRPEHKVLDVACGYGRKMIWLTKDGLSVEGVDINTDVIAAVRSQGLRAMTLKEFNASGEQYDAMLMAHIVEHFAPSELLAFIDGYLDRLKVGGHLIIATPVEWCNFFDDFDHAKPYYPNAFIMVFGQPESQVQYHSRNRLELIDVGLRRIRKGEPGYERLFATFYSAGVLWRFTRRVMDIWWRVLFRASGGVLGGRTNGWIGLFRKIG